MYVSSQRTHLDLTVSGPTSVPMGTTSVRFENRPANFFEHDSRTTRRFDRMGRSVVYSVVRAS